MEAKATIKYVRIGPRKVRHVMNLLRSRFVDEAFDILANLNKKGARLTEALLKSAVANAKIKKMAEEELFILDIRADGGPVFKRFMARAMGRADRILKRTSHLKVVLVEKKRKKKQPKDALNKKSEGDEKGKKKKVVKKKAKEKVAAKS